MPRKPKSGKVTIIQSNQNPTPKVSKENLSVIRVEPKTTAQKMMMDSFAAGNNIVAVGSSGTGKSYLATYLSLKSYMENQSIEKIVFVRSAVPTRDQGFLPGSLEEKNEVYSLPYKAIVNGLCNNGTAWDILTKKNYIEFITTSYVRGITLDNCICVLDEVQNLDFEELISVMTRMGDNSRLIILGDTKQSDLFRVREVSSFDKLMELCKRMPDQLDVINFLPADIVRSGFVRKLIMVLEN